MFLRHSSGENCVPDSEEEGGAGRGIQEKGEVRGKMPPVSEREGLAEKVNRQYVHNKKFNRI